MNNLYISLPLINYGHLTRYLYEELNIKAPAYLEIVEGGGFGDILEVQSSNKNKDTTTLKATHQNCVTCFTKH